MNNLKIYIIPLALAIASYIAYNKYRSKDKTNELQALLNKVMQLFPEIKIELEKQKKTVLIEGLKITGLYFGFTFLLIGGKK